MLYKTRKTISAEQFRSKEIKGVQGLDPQKLCGCVMYGNPHNVYPHVHPAIGCSKLVSDGDYVIDLGDDLFDVMTKEEFEKEYEPYTVNQLQIKETCKHEFKPLTEKQLDDKWMSEGAVCIHCKEDFGWRCKNSPDGVCYYHSDNGKVWNIFDKQMEVPHYHDSRYETSDSCIWCYLPDERK